MTTVRNPSAQTGTTHLWVWLVLLWLAVTASALGVVYAAHSTRVHFGQLEQLRHQQRQLQLIWSQYLLEESTWASYGRIEQVAREQLSMTVPTAEHMIEVRMHGR